LLLQIAESDAPVFQKPGVFMWGHGKEFHELEELKNVHLNVKQIACGSDFKVALTGTKFSSQLPTNNYTDNDEIYTWGRNNFGMSSRLAKQSKSPNKFRCNEKHSNN